MVETARAAVLPDFNMPLEIREYSLPSKIESGAMLVRVEMAGVCGTDVHLWKGQLPIPRPIILGHETVGVIERLGGLQKKRTTRAVGLEHLAKFESQPGSMWRKRVNPSTVAI